MPKTLKQKEILKLLDENTINILNILTKNYKITKKEIKDIQEGEYYLSLTNHICLITRKNYTLIHLHPYVKRTTIFPLTNEQDDVILIDEWEKANSQTWRYVIKKVN